MGDHENAGRALWPAILLLIVSVFSISAAMTIPPAQARQVAVVFSPTANAGDVATAIAQSGSLFVRAGAFDNVVIVQLADNKHYTELYLHGAWLVLDHVAAGGCAINNNF